MPWPQASSEIGRQPRGTSAAAQRQWLGAAVEGSKSDGWLSRPAGLDGSPGKARRVPDGAKLAARAESSGPIEGTAPGSLAPGSAGSHAASHCVRCRERAAADRVSDACAAAPSVRCLGSPTASRLPCSPAVQAEAIEPCERSAGTGKRALVAAGGRCEPPATLDHGGSCGSCGSYEQLDSLRYDEEREAPDPIYTGPLELRDDSPPRAHIERLEEKLKEVLTSKLKELDAENKAQQAKLEGQQTEMKAQLTKMEGQLDAILAAVKPDAGGAGAGAVGLFGLFGRSA
eukprot:tig00020629_g12423.t1